MQSTLSNSVKPEEKNISTENSQNSTHQTLLPTNNKQNEGDSSFRLFTFMNVRHDGPKLTKESGKNRRKSFKKISNKGLSRDSSHLMNMIEESRKKRESFYKLIIDSQCLTSFDNERKCRTPTNTSAIGSRTPPHQPVSTKHNLSVKCFQNRKIMTQRETLDREQKPEPKVKHMKNSNSQFKLDSKKTKPDLKDKTDTIEEREACLLRRKKELEKELSQINQTLLLGKKKAKPKLKK